MTKREQLRENYEDALFALLMEEVAQQEGKRLLEENERLKQDPNAAVPEEVSRRCLQTIRRTFARERRREVGRITYRVLSKAASVAMIAILLLMTAFAVVPDLRINTLNLLIEISDVATSLRLSDATGSTSGSTPASAAESAETLWGYRIPEIPEGYALGFQRDTKVVATLYYWNANEDIIVFEIQKAGNSPLNVDTENAEVENIVIHGYEGLLIEKDDRVDIIWGDTDRGNFVSVICTNLDKEIVLGYANVMEYVS